ncbi:hypothetical protein Plhal304r1_c014g0053301 [Plasmopara halstedii]
MWLLWDDSTLAAVITSPLMVRILAGPLSTAFRETFIELREQATKEVTSVPTHL